MSRESQIDVRSGRLTYLRLEHGVCKLAIYEVDNDGVEGFFDQEPGEVHWFAFAPSDAEAIATRHLFAARNSLCGWTHRVDVDCLRRFANDSHHLNDVHTYVA